MKLSACFFLLLSVVLSQAQPNCTWQRINSLSQLPAELVPGVEKLNGLDRKYFVGKKLLVPKDSLAAANFQPFPDTLPAQALNQQFIVVDLSQRRLAAYAYGRLVFWCPITPGRGRSTPLGVFSIQHKWRRIISRKYGNIPMPYALHLVGNICIHQGPMVGYPASHGCIRLFKRDAIRLYQWAQVGAKVSIIKNTAP